LRLGFGANEGQRAGKSIGYYSTSGAAFGLLARGREAARPRAAFAPGLIGICPDTCIASSQFRYEVQTGRRSDYLATRSSRKANRTARGRDKTSKQRHLSQTSRLPEVKCAAELEHLSVFVKSETPSLRIVKRAKAWW